MSKAADLAKVSAKNSFHYMWGLIVSTVISSIGVIVIARLLGSDLYGLYGIVVAVPALIGIFGDWGVNAAMIRFTAQYRDGGRETEIRNLFISGLIFEIAVGIALSAITFGASFFLASSVYNRPNIAPLIQIASLTIVTQGIANAATALFTGLERMEHNSVLLICVSTIKTALIITLVIAGLGTSGAVIGYTTAMIISGLIGALLMWVLYKKLPKPNIKKFKVKTNIKLLLTFGAPLSLATIISGFQAQFYAFLLPIYYLNDNTTIGSYYIATTFLVLITFFATPITSMLFPAFSKLNLKDDKETAQNVYQFSIKYTSIFVVPIAALVMCLAQPAVSTLFGNTYGPAPLFLALLPITYLYTALGTLTNGNFITSQGKTKLAFYLTALTAIIGFPMGYTLIMNFGVMGLIVTTLIARIPSMFILIIWIKKHFELTVDWNSSAKILLSSAIAAIPTYALASTLGTSDWIRLLLGVICFTAIFLVATLCTRAIIHSDISNLRGMFTGLGSLSRLVTIIFDLIEKIMNFFKL